MLVFRQVKSFINCLSIYQMEFLFKFFGIFMMIVFLFICQMLGIMEIIPSVHAMSLIEESIDEPIPLQFMGTEDSFSIQSSESNFYEEIAEEQEEIIPEETPTLLPGWSNKQVAKCSGLLIGMLTALATSTYLFVLQPDTEFNCEAWRNTNNCINEFLSNLF